MRRRLILLVVQFTAVLSALVGCASLPSQEGRGESHAIEKTADTRLGQIAVRAAAPHPGQSACMALPDGVEALVARLALAGRAERSLDLQYYIWHDDLTGRYLTEALLRAADRGVRVRVLLDDVGARADDQVLSSLDAHPNIEIRLFNPVAWRSLRLLGTAADFGRVNRRMHNKAFVADNQVAILGGRNIGDEYFGAPGDVAFGDLDVLTTGRVVPEVSASFDRYWNSSHAYPIATLLGRPGDPAQLAALRGRLANYVAAQRDSAYASEATESWLESRAGNGPRLHWGQVRLLADDPDKIELSADEIATQRATNRSPTASPVRRELLIVSPYFVPGDKGVAALAALVARGVRVTVLTNSLAATDVGAVHAGYARQRKALLVAGVRLYELRPHADKDSEPAARRKKDTFGSSRASLHAKTFIFDRESVFIGSLNLDPRSLYLNTEVGLVCESAALSAMLADGIERGLDSATWQVLLEDDTSGRRLAWMQKDGETFKKLDAEPEVGTLRKLGVWLLGLLPIESQL
ncbi:phospholipase D family protein [Rivibacter subsaxonicus]|uniref:Putative cardiolipin synthase n=1 Tax=Rivibacter subsaxonicus TaxID=457575 RepID=A0A4Q7VP44_9BURK|nr:phospholipase D family protein [Rivibacter subsaxonicus]RZT97947.1 putative cardiolipin synthase [Rivibacter subsaxonicus]